MIQPPYYPFDVAPERPPQEAGPLPVVEGTTEQPAAPMRAPCRHLGSRRRCCDRLFICRESPHTNCVTAGVAAPGVRSCETCDRWEPSATDSKAE